MRTDTQNFVENSQRPDKSPHFAVELSFTDDHSVRYFFTTHADTLTESGVSSISNCVLNLSGVSQRIEPEKALATIGNLSFELQDADNQITDLLNAQNALGRGLNKKRVRVYMGFEELDSFSDYTLVQTQIVESVEQNANTYTIKCSDIQREERKDLFEVPTTTLTDSIDDTTTTIPVFDVTDFELLEHGNSYSDAPSTSVGYIRIDDEVIRWTSKTTSDPTYGHALIADQRGALNTKAEEHNIDTDTSQENRTEVEEYVYLELPFPKLLYALLTGDLIGQSGKTLPSTWHLGIDTQYVRQGDFTNKSEWWDTSNDDASIVLRFDGLDKEDGKKFIERELLLLMGAFMPVYNSGELGLRRLTGVLSRAAYVRHLVADDYIIDWSDLEVDMEDILNKFLIKWNYLPIEERFTRRTLILDTDSSTVHGESEEKDFEFKGLHGSRHSAELIYQLSDAMRDRFAGPPLRITVTCNSRVNDLEVGDVIRLDLPHVRDYIDGGTLDRAFEVQRVNINYKTGKVQLTLFGSSQKSTAAANHSQSSVLEDSFYTSTGNEIESYISSNCTGNYSLIGDVGHITGDCTFTGNADLNSAVFYYDGDLTIDPGVTLTITDNVQLRINGTLTVDGDIDGAGQGISAYASAWEPHDDSIPAGVTGFFGNTEAGGGVGWPFYVISTRAQLFEGKYTKAPSLSLINSAGTSLIGIPDDLRGTAGAQGLETDHGDLRPGGSTGGAGGNGGAGLMVICKGMAFGVSGGVNSSGNDGQKGGCSEIGTSGPIYACAGSGGGGAPGAVYVLLDGSAANIPSEGKFTANHGATPINGQPAGSPKKSALFWNNDGDSYSHYTGIGASDQTNEAVWVQYVPAQLNAEEDDDAGPVEPPTGLNVQSGNPYYERNADGTINVRAYLTWTPSGDPRVAGYEPRYKKYGGEWVIGKPVIGRAAAELYVDNLLAGQNYDFGLRAVTSLGETSQWVPYGIHLVVGKDDPPGLPSAITISPAIGGIDVTIDAADMPDDDDLLAIEWLSSTTNDRDNPTDTQRGILTVAKGEDFSTRLYFAAGVTRYLWFRTLDTSRNFSSNYIPSSATAGLSATPTAVTTSSLEDALATDIETALANKSIAGANVNDWTDRVSGDGTTLIYATHIRIDKTNKRIYFEAWGYASVATPSLSYSFQIEVFGAQIQSFTDISFSETISNKGSNIDFSSDNSMWGPNGIIHDESVAYDGADRGYWTLDKLDKDVVFRLKITEADQSGFFITLGDRVVSIDPSLPAEMYFSPVDSEEYDVLLMTNAPAAAGANVNAPTIGIIPNCSVFGLGEGSNSGEAYIHGFDDSGNPADVDGYIQFSGQKIYIDSAQTLLTDRPNESGYLVFDTTKSNKFSMNGGGTTRSIVFAKKERGQWYYDGNNSNQWHTFTPATTDVIIGTLTTDGEDSIGDAQIWGYGISLAGAPESSADVTGDNTANDTNNVGSRTSGDVNNDIDQAIADAATAQSTADGKIQSFYQTSAPSGQGEADGDIWFDTDDGNKIYRRVSGSWTSAQDSDIAQALSDASTAQATADGKVTTFYATSGSPPTAEGVGDLWYQTDTGQLHRWDGTDWDTQVSDNTQNAIESNLEITQGYIRNGTNIVIDFLNKFFGIKTGSYSESVACVAVDYNGGTPKAYLGDGDEAYFKVDTENGVIETGRDVVFRGSDAIYNDNLYLNETPPHLDNDAKSETGGGYAEYENSLLKIGCLGLQTGLVLFHRYASLELEAPTWDKVRILRMAINLVGLDSDNEIMIGTGAADFDSNNESLGFYFDGSTWYARAADGTASTETPLSSFAGTSGDHVFEIVLNPSTNAKFYVDGTFERSLTTNIPSGTSHAGTVLRVEYEKTSTASGGSYLHIGRLKFLQER